MCAPGTTCSLTSRMCCSSVPRRKPMDVLAPILWTRTFCKQSIKTNSEEIISIMWSDYFSHMIKICYNVECLFFIRKVKTIMLEFNLNLWKFQGKTKKFLYKAKFYICPVCPTICMSPNKSCEQHELFLHVTLLIMYRTISLFGCLLTILFPVSQGHRDVSYRQRSS